MHSEREWVEEIRRDYQEKSVKESKVERLQKLDRAARRPANIFAYTFGVIGALVLGVGMCLAMGVIGDLFALGIVTGILGIAMVSVNYFIYRAIAKAGRKKYAGQILALSDELLGDE